MKRVVFLVGTLSWTARRGDAMSQEDFQVLADVAEKVPVAEMPQPLSCTR